MGPTISWTWCPGGATRRAYPTRWSGSGTTTGTRTGRSFPRADCRGRRLLRTPDPEASDACTEVGGRRTVRSPRRPDSPRGDVLMESYRLCGVPEHLEDARARARVYNRARTTRLT